MGKIMDTQKKIEENVVNGYQAIEDGVVNGYRAIENGVVSGYKKIEDKFVSAFLSDNAPQQEPAEGADLAAEAD